MISAPELTLESLTAGQILPVAKPAGWTSFDVVNKLRYATRVRKVGHAGTLDPFATGLLLICFGKATRESSSLMGLQKEYVATLQLGAETDSHDRTGKIRQRGEIPELTEKQLEKVLRGFRGEIQQVPPMFSALKHKGKRLYKLAREGVEVEREPRAVTIYELELLRQERDLLELRIVCSKGTYIRALARDIGRKLGCGAYLEALQRTRIGDYRLNDAWSIDDFIEAFGGPG